MLRLLSIRNFVVVETLDLELDAGFTVLTGETGAGKSILLDALDLILGGSASSCGNCRPGPSAPSSPPVFELPEHPGIAEWLAEHDLARPTVQLLVRRTLDAPGRSRAWINGRPATLAQ
jgi:DNA repair protein RecN (Recombination protein N)